ncbi:MAG TPA: rhomboid family intramembrane serine protease [Candidatus Eisenbacteria bacterium]|nr:rhomboid family intramembrane serine protease [Candidatus Eisenbacteria bacterium]
MIPLRDRNPSGSFPAVTVAIIVACVVAFLYEVLAQDQLRDLFSAYALIPAKISYALQTQRLSDLVTPFFSSMFLHGGWLHLIGNMWYLWIFGDNVEDALGPVGFLLFYLFTGLAAGITHYVLQPESAIPTVGASGAISGVLAGYAVLFPRARVVTLVPLGFFIQLMELPAVVLLVIWVVIQALSGLVSFGVGQSGGVAWGAHVGGFVAGLVLVKLFRPRRVMA